jgi:hypothetical protein
MSTIATTDISRNQGERYEGVQPLLRVLEALSIKLFIGLKRNDSFQVLDGPIEKRDGHRGINQSSLSRHALRWDVTV